MVGGPGRLGKTNLKSCHIQNPDIENKERRMETIWVRREDRVRGDAHGHSTRVHA